MRAICPACGRTVGAHIPRNGDGSAVRLRSHTRLDDLNALCYGNRLVDRGCEIDGDPRVPSTSEGEGA